MTGGYLSFLGAVQLVPMLMVAFVGILVGDLVIFSAGRKYGNDLTGSRWFSRLVTEDKRCQVEGYFARHGSKLVLMARFLPGVRVVTYFVAGASPMPTWRFLIVDALAACASVPLWMLLGRRLGKHLPTLIVWVERTHRALLVLGLVFLAFGMLTLLRRSRRMVYPQAELRLWRRPGVDRRSKVSRNVASRTNACSHSSLSWASPGADTPPLPPTPGSRGAWASRTPLPRLTPSHPRPHRPPTPARPRRSRPARSPPS